MSMGFINAAVHTYYQLYICPLNAHGIYKCYWVFIKVRVFIYIRRCMIRGGTTSVNQRKCFRLTFLRSKFNCVLYLPNTSTWLL